MNIKKSILAAALAAGLFGAAHADLTVGVVLPLTGPASGLGIPVKNQIALWPKTIAGENLKVVVLDDATDPTTGVKDTQRLVTEDKVDVIIGSAATPVAIPMADVAAESGTVQLAASPAGLPPGKDKWTFRLPQSNDVMAYAVVQHMKSQKVKTIGFLGYTDAYGESWLRDFTAKAEPAGIKVVAAERFARTDTSVTAQALKLATANPDAMLIVASGSGAAMPHKAIVERGYKGRIYQTHAAASRDLMRSSSCPQPESAISSVRLPHGSRRMRRASSKPSMRGSPRSRIPTCGSVCSAAVSADSPSNATSTSHLK